MEATLTYPQYDISDSNYLQTSSFVKLSELRKKRSAYQNVIYAFKIKDNVTGFTGDEVQRNFVDDFETTFANIVIIQEQSVLALRKLEKFRYLEDNWNGYGAERLDYKLIDEAQRLIRYIDNRVSYTKNFFPEIFPTAADCVQLEFEPNDDYYLEIEIYLDHFHIFTICEETEKSLESLNYKELIGYIKEFKLKYEASKR